MNLHLNRNVVNKPSAVGPTARASLLAAICSLGIVLIDLCLGTQAVAVIFPLPGDALACSNNLAQWQEIWFRWGVGALTLPLDSNGNAVSNKVVLLRDPSQNIGSVDVTINANQPSVLQIFTYYGGSYRDGTPDDKLCSLSVFQTLHLNLAVDGTSVMDGV